ncbi:MAG TPA: alkaline phosphatase family protein [Vicinamibacterales bacterium]|nr:alkaline phosphatase family protein [Vicinamibacterales bacterium]
MFIRNNKARRVALVAAALSLLSVAIQQPSAQTPAAPKLLVIVVVDQLRFDYLDRYKSLWTAGLKRLTTEAAVFERAYYPYLNTVTCSGHATIGTGALPATHGVIMNEWWQRGQKRRMSCTDDPAIVSVPYGSGAAERIGHSAHRLRVPTLADRLRASTPDSRVVALSMKPRSTVMLAGHAGTAVTWFADSNTWATSSAFAAQPVAPVQAFVTANPVERDSNVTWDRMLDPARYTGVDAGIGERGPAGWNALFPHPLQGSGSGNRFFDLWERSPFSDVYLGKMAAQLVRDYQLGQRDVVDFLGVSFSALDYVGHDFGPNSHEVQDTLARLDRTLGDLFTALDATVGRDRYVVGLSADHGVADIPEANTAAGRDAGRVLNADIRRVGEDAMTAAHGVGPHIAHVEYTNVYLTDAARGRAAASPAYLAPLVRALSATPGVQRVFPSAGLEARRMSSDPIERAAALSHFPGESGEVVVVLKPNWIGTDTSTTTHGSLQPYDQHVPVIFMGTAFKPGRYTHPASPADVAPTLAVLVGLPMPGIDGQVRREALKPR